MEKRRPKKPDWEALERASIARSREDYKATTPGERVESMLELSLEVTKLASRARARIGSPR